MTSCFTNNLNLVYNYFLKSTTYHIKNQLAKIYYFHQLIITYFIILVVGQTLLCPHLLHSPLQGVTNNLLQRGHRNKVTSFIKLLQTGQPFAILIPSLNYDLSHKPANQKGCNPRTKPN